MNREQRRSEKKRTGVELAFKLEADGRMRDHRGRHPDNPRFEGTQGRYTGEADQEKSPWHAR